MKNLELLLPQVPARGESWRWGVVSGPGEVVLSGDTDPVGVTDSLVPYVPGDRVLVRMSGVRAMVMGASRGGMTSGLQAIPKMSFSNLGNNIFGASVFVPVPYEPPPGWGFVYTGADTNGWTSVQTVGRTVDGVTPVRVLNVLSSAPSISWLQWQLVKQ